jgi:predicted cobalt transporter CbtA
MTGSLLVRGMLIGILAGVLAVGFGKVFGEPYIDRAIAFEVAGASHAHDHGHEHGSADAAEPEEPELVSRDVQSGIGFLTAGIIYGAGLGGLFALVFAFAYGRVGPFGPRSVAALLALAGFLTIYFLPSLKYPANPPAVGDADTIGYRTALFFGMIAIAIVAMTAAIAAGKRLVARHGSWNGSLIAAAGFIVVIVLAQFLLPGINEVPEEFPATVLWQFRLASFGMQVVLWATLGLAFGAAAEKVMLR